MQDSGLIEIESHSDTHEYMGDMSTTELQRELRRSRYLIETELDKDSGVFSFPYGGNTEEARRLGIMAGYTMSCLVGDVGANSATGDVSALRRITISGLLTGEELLETIYSNLDK